MRSHHKMDLPAWFYICCALVDIRKTTDITYTFLIKTLRFCYNKHELFNICDSRFFIARNKIVMFTRHTSTILEQKTTTIWGSSIEVCMVEWKMGSGEDYNSLRYREIINNLGAGCCWWVVNYQLFLKRTGVRG